MLNRETRPCELGEYPYVREDLPDHPETDCLEEALYDAVSQLMEKTLTF